MIKLILLGVLSSAFFSFTFVLNEIMSADGGHWVWSGSLRYVFMMFFLIAIVLFKGGLRQLRDVFLLFFTHWRFWVFTGTVGFGAFYALVCFAADFSPGWVVAATWQFTVVASLFVFMLFGRRFPLRMWVFSLIIFSGVVLVNLSHVEVFNTKTLLFGGLPMLLAAFCYPLGNQLVWEVHKGNHKRLPRITSPLLDDAFNKVLVMTLGALPLWLLIIVVTQPPAPSTSQVFNAALVAVFSGVLGTSLFLFARHLASNTGELAAVDATQSSEVIFALLGGIMFLHTELPNMSSVAGLVLVFVGLILFVKYQKGPSGEERC